jgi:hypothetical protein
MQTEKLENTGLGALEIYSDATIAISGVGMK